MSSVSLDFNNAIALVWVEFEANYPRDLVLKCVDEALVKASSLDVLNSAEAASVAAHVKRLTELFGERVSVLSTRNDIVWLNSSTLLHCRSIGALLWLVPDSAGCYAEQASIARLQAVAAAQGWPILQIVQGLAQPVTLAPFDLSVIALKISLAQTALNRSGELNQQRRMHVVAISLVFLVLSAAGLWFAKDNPWQAFVVAVIYAPLLIAAVLTVVFVVQRLKAVFLARFP